MPTAARYPVKIFVALVISARIAAGNNTGGMLVGSVERPKKTKKIAANRARSGERSCWALCATRPDSAIATRNAPTAAETLTPCAIPATSMGSPRTPSSKDSEWSAAKRREMT
jgi:hypothetical protein